MVEPEGWFGYGAEGEEADEVVWGCHDGCVEYMTPDDVDLFCETKFKISIGFMGGSSRRR